MHRRTLLLASLLVPSSLVVPSAAAAPSRPLIQPQSAKDGDQVRLEVGSGFSCPALRARVLGLLHLQNAALHAVAFGADSLGCVTDLLALVGPDGRLLALDVLTRTEQGGPTITTRYAALADRRHITLERTGARRLTPTTWQRESWTDYWRWNGTILENAPPRPVLAGTWQHRIAERRKILAALLLTPRFTVDQAMLAEATAPLPLSPLALAK
jgi:hypothetical protein